MLGIASHCYAHDLGTMGRTYPIKEVDIKKVVAEQASHVNWQEAGRRLKESTKTYFKRLPTYALPSVSQTKTTYVDPSVAFNRNFSANGRVFYHKGTWVNPLTRVRPVTDMLYFNGNDPAQVKFVLGVIKAHPLKVEPVMTSGNPRALAKEINRPVYYANKRLLKRFHITHVPALLGVGQGNNEFNLAITSFAKPYHVGMVELCWHGCSRKDIRKFLKLG